MNEFHIPAGGVLRQAHEFLPQSGFLTDRQVGRFGQAQRCLDTGNMAGGRLPAAGKIRTARETVVSGLFSSQRSTPANRLVVQTQLIVHRVHAFCSETARLFVPVAMPEKITVSSLSYQAASRVHLLESLIRASKGLWGANSRMGYAFWLSARLAAITPEAQLSWLPALALAVERETEPDVLHQMADWPRPDTIPQEAIPWLAALTSAWKQHLDVRFRGALARPLHQELGYQGIVRWSHPAGCHLAEWLQYVRRIAGDHEVPGSWLAAFAGALANWQGEEPLQAEKHTVREWISFWEEQSL